MTHDEQKVRNCLDILQEAQTLINIAAGELCPVAGFADQWSSLSETHDAVKAAWYRVESRRVGLRDQLAAAGDETEVQ